METNQKAWPQFKDFPQTEAGWNDYANQWAGLKHNAPMAAIPMDAVQEHRQSLELGRKNGWQENEDAL